jgi:hypothetical protein
MFRTNTINIRIKDEYVVVSTPIDNSYIGERQNPTGLSIPRSQLSVSSCEQREADDFKEITGR